MGKCIYGIDMEKEITPIAVRDAIIRCFKIAHEDILDMMKETESFSSKKEFEQLKDINVKLLVKAKIEEAGGDFEHPTKESLHRLIDILASFAKQFRAEKIITKHKEEIYPLLDKL